MGTFSDLGSSRNSPSAPSNEPHTSPVPGYEAVEATGVASVGAIEPASSSQLSDGGGHQTRRPVTGRTHPLNAPTGSHRLNSLTNDPPLRQAERKDSAWCARSDREKFWEVCSRPNSHTEFTHESIRTRGSGFVRAETLPEAECHAVSVG